MKSITHDMQTLTYLVFNIILNESNKLAKKPLDNRAKLVENLKQAIKTQKAINAQLQEICATIETHHFLNNFLEELKYDGLNVIEESCNEQIFIELTNNIYYIKT